jgi:hypothetical protein
MHPFHKAVLACASLVALASAGAQSLTSLTNQPPVRVSLPLLLTDGSVMAQAGNTVDWYRLRPDSTGSYLNGKWKKLASIPPEWDYAPDAMASAVLADGRVVIVGGEYNHGQFLLTNKGAIYDPVADRWDQLAPPPTWANIGDSQSVVLPDGRFVVGRKLDKQVAALDPATLQWTLLGSQNKKDFNSEEGWTLMPDGTVLTVDVKKAPHSERYLPDQGAWVSNGSTIVDLHTPTDVQGCIPYPGGCYYPPGEVGPLVLRPDGTVFATGSAEPGQNAHSAIYTPGSNNTDPGTWTVGPDFPDDSAGDASASLLTNGNVLVWGNSGKLYEFDGSTLAVTATATSGGILLPLPNGQTLLTGRPVQVYTHVGEPDPAWAPTITSLRGKLKRGHTYPVQGTQFNGLSQAAAFGDEFETSTNYPMVRITNKASGQVVYARTHDHSTMAVATGTLPVSTFFDVPKKAEAGASTVEVVANGIPSAKVEVVIE